MLSNLLSPNPNKKIEVLAKNPIYNANRSPMVNNKMVKSFLQSRVELLVASESSNHLLGAWALINQSNKGYGG